ncbi:MAG: hypothetical protein P8Y02_03285 [Deinococcales bacterium]|jgi:hypothetical protein
MDTTPDGGAPVACANINRSERRRRLTFGLVALGVGLVAFVLLLAGGAERWWRLPLIVLFYPAAVGYFQWRDHTCVALAARQQRKLGDRIETIEDPEELAQVRVQATGVQRKSLAAAALLMVVVLLVP